jgi:hypothetical protein
MKLRLAYGCERGPYVHVYCATVLDFPDRHLCHDASTLASKDGQLPFHHLADRGMLGELAGSAIPSAMTDFLELNRRCPALSEPRRK